jgi:acetyl esterase/lipase
LVGGYSLYPAFFNPWYLELAKENSAIIVSPDYRLLPESSVMDILEDVEDNWKWIPQALPTFLEQQTEGTIKADLSRIMCVGDSAGGYLSLQMGLNHPSEIRAINAVYPVVDFKSPHFCNGQERPVFNMPTFPRDCLERHMEEVKRQETLEQKPVIVSSRAGNERLELMFSLCQHGRLGSFFPDNTIAPYPLKKLDHGARFPRGGVLVLHGKDDTVAPVEQSYGLANKLAEIDPELNFKLIVRDGEHGFDHSAKLRDEWLWNAVQDILKAWLE